MESIYKLAAAAILLLAACSPTDLPQAQTAESAKEAETEADARIPVEIAVIERRDVQETLRLNGTTRLWDEFVVSSEIAGRVSLLTAEEGAWVDGDQILVELDKEKRRLDLETRRAQLARTQVELEYVRKNVARGESLLGRGAISQAEVDTLKQSADLAENAVKLARLAVEVMEEEIRDATIRAPVAGQVSRRHVSMGASVRASEPLYTLVQYNPIKVVTEIPEMDVYKVALDQAVEIGFDALGDRVFRGTVERISPIASTQSGSFSVELRVANPGYLLKAGMVARLRLPGALFRDALVAPLNAVLESERGAHVFVLDGDVVRRRDVEIVHRLRDQAILTGSLEVGDQIVTRGNINLTEGAPVEVVH